MFNYEDFFTTQDKYKILENYDLLIDYKYTKKGLLIYLYIKKENNLYLNLLISKNILTILKIKLNKDIVYDSNIGGNIPFTLDELFIIFKISDIIKDNNLEKKKKDLINKTISEINIHTLRKKFK